MKGSVLRKRQGAPQPLPAPAREPTLALVPRSLDKPARLAALDALRGLVIVLMVLDHARDMFGLRGIDPLDLAQSSPMLFMTRWITHLCAPVFIFLAGMAAWLHGRQIDRGTLQRYLLTRGAWLVLLEVTVVHLAWFMNLAYSMGIFLQVIWAIGIS